MKTSKITKNKRKLNIKPWMIVGIILLAFIVLLVFLRSPEDYWMMDERGVWVMHGNVSEENIPIYVKDQQWAVECAENLKIVQGLRGVGSNSECLGSCGFYAVDVVHVPRIESDNFAENQCNAYLNGTLQHFIEVGNEDGKVVRVV